MTSAGPSSAGMRPGTRKRVKLQIICVLALVLGAQAMISSPSRKLQQLYPNRSSATRKLLSTEDRGSMPYREARIYEVGGAGTVWAIPSTPTYFQKWASTITFRAGDVLQFNKPAPGDIAEILDDVADYIGCDTPDYAYTNIWINSGYENVFFIKLHAGTSIHYFLHVSPSNCTKGLQFAATEAIVPIPAPPVQPPTTTQLKGRAAQVFEVGGTGKAWAVPSNTNFYVNWAANISFQKGDELRFNFANSDYEVSEVPYEEYESCLPYEKLWNTSSSSTTYKFEKTGVHYFVASGPVQYCLQGMKFMAFAYCADGTLCIEPDNAGRAERKKISLITGFAVAGAVVLCCICGCLSRHSDSISGGATSSSGGSRPTAFSVSPPRDREDELDRRPGRAAWDGDGER